jgi:hypothetical protein
MQQYVPTLTLRHYASMLSEVIVAQQCVPTMLYVPIVAQQCVPTMSYVPVVAQQYLPAILLLLWYRTQVF